MERRARKSASGRPSANPLAAIQRAAARRLRDTFVWEDPGPAARSASFGGRLRGRFRLRLRRSYRIPIEGIVFVGVTLLIGLAAMNTGQQLLYLVFGMLCAFWIISDIMATTSMTGVRLRRRAPSVVSARHPVRVAIELENTKKVLSSFSLRVIDSLAGAERLGAAFFGLVRPGEKVQESYTIFFPRRGRYRLERLSISTRFPFGLIERTFGRIDPWEIVVLPPVLAPTRLLKRAEVEIGEFASNRKGSGTSLHSIRDYSPGESARDIHWRLSARTGSLVVREYEVEERRRASVLLDNRLSDPSDAAQLEALEKAIVLASSLVGHLCERGHQVELITASGEVRFGTGGPHATRCRRALAELNAVGTEKSDPLSCTTARDSLRVAVLTNRRAVAGGTVSLHIDEYEEELSEAITAVAPSAERLREQVASIWSIEEVHGT